jgi:hypothetical protein
LNEKELLTLADAPEPRPGGNRRNFADNPQFRALFELANAKIRFFQAEGAALLVEPGRSVLFAPEPDPEEELWSGAMPSLAELSEGCGVEVRPIDEFEAPPETLTVPAQDAESAAVQSDARTDAERRRSSATATQAIERTTMARIPMSMSAGIANVLP